MSLKKCIEKTQHYFDDNTAIVDRRKHGQFFTPFELTNEIVLYGLSLQNDDDICYLEPAFGMGAFFYSLLQAGKDRNIKAIGIEQDEWLYNQACDIWKNSSIELINGDFTKIDKCDKRINLLITNPPYVRHHFIELSQKERMKEAIKQELNISVSGLAGLYCYFLLLSDKWLAPGAVSGWLIPSEFMDVNYGDSIKDYLLNKVHLVRIHRYDPSDSMFDDALVSSCVVWFKNEKRMDDYDVQFTFGGTHNDPHTIKNIKKSELLNEKKWTRFPEKEVRIKTNYKTLNDFFSIKRGLATGDNSFFILTKEQIEQHNLSMDYFIPILPSPRKLKNDEVFADNNNYPQIEPQYFLLNCDLPEEKIEKELPSLWAYLLSGVETTAKKYLCRNRKLWYYQEKREATPFLCSYMGRSGGNTDTPFRFILNHSNAIAANTYLMLYPKKQIADMIESDPAIITQIWQCLKTITADDFENEGRVYGGGLRKIEPRELGKIRCRALNDMIE